MFLTSCGLGDRVRHVQTETYAKRSDAPTQGNLAFKLPDLIPPDATDITVKVQTQSDGRMYSWTSASAQLPADCRSGDTSDARPFSAKDWPASVYEAPAFACGPLPVHVRRGPQMFYAWW